MKENETLIVDGEDDGDADECDDRNECHKMSLESKVLNGVVATFTPELIIRQGENGQDPGTTVLKNKIRNQFSIHINVI